MKALLAILALPIALAAVAQEAGVDCAYPGLPCAPASGRLGPGLISLTQPTTFRYPSLEIADGTIIETNGLPLTITVDRDLKVLGSATLRSFNPAATPPDSPRAAAAGQAGISFDPGPKTEGAPGSSRGSDGGAGAAGEPGAPGGNGRPAATIVVKVGGRATGRLVVRNDGQRGADGGPGGAGGAGGDGQQGGRASPAFVGCAKGGGLGGNGGDGGPGGIGGTGGPGGAGGRVEIEVRGGGSLLVDATARPGPRGGPGASGASGPPGRAGFGGRGARVCQGEETNRIGSPGRSAAPAAPAQAPPAETPADAPVVVSGAKLAEGAAARQSTVADQKRGEQP